MINLPKPFLLLAAASALAAPPGALGGTRASSVRSHSVVLKNIRFHPGVVRINRGNSVTWTWRDQTVARHNVTSSGRSHFKSSPTQFAGTYSVRFTRRGTYPYVCTIHANMMGRIVVR